MTALLAFGVGWAATETYTYQLESGHFNTSTTTHTDNNGFTWSLNLANNSYCQWNSNVSALQIGSAKQPAGNTTFQTSDISGTITQVTVTAWTGGTSTASVSVDGNNYTPSSTTLGSSTADYTFTGASSGALIITFNASSKAMYLSKVSVTIETGGTPTPTCQTPTFSPAAGTYTSAQNVTISCGTSGATIYYTTDGSTPTTSSSVYSTAIPVSKTTTIKALATANGYNNSTIAEATYTISTGGSTSTVYHKVTKESDLAPERKYIIVYEDVDNNKASALSTFGSSTGSSASTFNAITNLNLTDHTVDIGSNSNIVVLTLGGSTDAWTLYYDKGNISGYIAGNNSTNFNIVSSTQTTGALWKISNDGIINNVSYTTRYIRYYASASSPSFRHYTTSNGAEAYLYVQDSGETPTPTVAVPTFSYNEEAVTGSVAVDYGETITLNSASGTVISYTTDNTNPSTSNTATLSTSNTAQVMITEGCTIRAIALDGDANESDEASLTVTLNPLAITLNPATESAATGEAITVGVTANTLGDVVYEYSCSPAGATVTATANGFTITSTNAGTYTVTVSAIDEAYREATAMGTYTFTAPVETNQYNLVKNTTSIDDNSTYVLIYNSTNAMSSTLTGGYLAQITNGFSVSGEIASVESNSEVDILTLESIGDNYYYIKDATGYIQNTSSSTIARDNAPSTDNFKWEITIDNNLALIQNKSTGRYLAYNTSSPRFAAYTSVTGQQKAAALYQRESTNPKLTVPATVDLGTVPVGTSESEAVEFTISGSHLTGNVSVSIASEELANFIIVPSLPATLSPDANGNVSQNFLISYTGTNVTGATATITVTSDGAATKTITVTGKKATPTAPEIDVPTGTYYEDQDVVISAQEGTTLVYTIDGVSTTVNDNEVIIEVPYGTGTTTVTATAYEGNNASETTTVTYTWGTVTVTISPETGSTFMGRTISGSISVEPSDAQVTMTGATYNAQDKTFVSDEVLAVGGQVTVQATATKGNATANATATYTRVAAPAPAAPTFSIPAGAVAAGTQVTITAPAGTTLYVNGVAQSNPYTVTISTATTIQAYCVNEDENTQSDTVTNFYSISSSGGSGDGNIYEEVISPNLIDGDTYILVYEGTPSAMGAISSGKGSAVVATWEKHDERPYQVSLEGANELIAHSTGTQYQYQFELANGSYLGWSSGANFNNTVTDNGAKWTVDEYGTITNVKENSRSVIYRESAGFAPYASSNAGTSDYHWAYLYHKVNSTPAVVVDAPVITPVTGTYYENQNVTITAQDGVTIYYTTDGSNPTTLSNVYSSSFPAEYVSGGTVTIKAIAINAQGVASEVAMETYTWGVPTVSINPDSKYVADDHVSVILSSTPADASIYYTINGSEPTNESTLYSNAFTVDLPNVGDEVTVKAIAYVGNLPSEIATATYTRVNKVIDVNAPFFSPIENYTYYGDQEIEILCTTENADIYYEVVPASGVTVPDASQVATPTKSSTHYTGPISMTVGNSYYVKAIAYIGNFASEVAEGWFTIKSTSEWSTPTNATTVLENVAQMRTVSSGSRVTFRNPIQVVYMSTMCNDPTPGNYTHPVPEYVYVRDNSGYGVIYFGKGSTMWAKQTSGRRNSPAKIFEMGDWIAGNEIDGVTGTWDSGLIPQVGTKERDIYSWPADKLGNTPIIAEKATCADVGGGTVDNNLCGHYLHVRNTTLSGVMDYQEFNTNETNDYRHTGTISDASGACTYYDRFWLYSGTVDNGFHYPYTGYDNITYDICGLGHYDQAWFAAKGDNATFDIFCVGDYYAGMSNPYEVFPLDFLWIYKPVISLPSGEYTTEQTVTLTAEQPTWTVDPVTIYYKTDDMDDWAEYTSPIIVNSDTHIQAYAQVPTEKFNDIVRSVTVEATYEFANIKEPIITDDVDDNVIEVTTGNEEVNVTISTNPESPDAVTLYTTNGEVPTLENGIVVENGQVTLNPIKETTTVTAISYIEVSDGQGGTTLVWSNPVSETYTFVKSNGVVYDLVNTVTTDKIYVIVNKDAYMGLSTAQNGNNHGSTGVKFTDGTKEHVYGNAELALFVLESANAGRYYFKNINGDGYLTVTTNDVANLSTSATASSYSEAGVTIAQNNGYPATIMFNYDGTNRYLRYFAKGRTFTTNADATLNEEVFLYGTEATPLAKIESEMNAGNDVQVTVADDLIAAWAVDNGTEKYVWAKDMGYSINKTSPVTGQTDYVKTVMGWQTHDWDQSNWVILDFSGVSANLNELVGKKLTGSTVTGDYVEGKNNGGNYRIVLKSLPTAVEDAEAAKYPGLGVATAAITANAEGKYNPANYNLGYNTYMPGNFNTANLNIDGNNGFVAGEDAAPLHQGEKLFFMNPKTQEVARVWGVWDGEKFTIWECDNQNVNGWAIKGAFDVNWTRNAVSLSPLEYGKPEGISAGTEHIFHAVVALKQATGPGNAPRRLGENDMDDQTPASDEYEIYPLDLSNSGNPTSVKNVQANKTIESVRYYNIMGMESEQPFEGINIVVTRFSDGSTSTFKVLK